MIPGPMTRRSVSALREQPMSLVGMKTVENGRKNISTVFIFIFTLRDENENGVYR
jgi:hypothetical protein